MPLGTEVGLGLGDMVLDGEKAPPPIKEAQQLPNFRPIYCGQTAGWTKMPLGTEVGLGPGYIVLDEDPALPQKGGTAPSPIFDPYLLWPNGFMDQYVTWYEGRPRLPLPKNSTDPLPVLGPCLLWPNGWMDQHATWHLVWR